MPDGFEADVARLESRAGEFDGFAERAKRISGELAERLAASGDCWGTDDVGRSFASAHSEPAGTTSAQLGGLAGQLGEFGAKFASSARDYRAVDTDEAAGFEAGGET
ncbi:hypothetical protein EV191_10165 [Tamaricihabitans halophyticus]|uniref:Excreted virulence factor EspC (Type VII ESX diderm) n=1 Tax=Tamaricihabitans halophyticus TaxID=1262583 RepID=A0A4R2R9P4_9PSEU|nr:hypothetical protein [Tamaricihabitans halophyticus]TCP56125.1 hypothetical protein EV191_10165 [Tamaricihabitans halophyticus]